MKTIRKITVLIVLCVLLIITQTACGTKEPVSEEFFCLDTVCTVTVYGQEQKAAESVIADAIALCKEYENILSRTIKGSDVDKINTAGGRPVTVSDDTVAVIEKGIRFGELSGGKFDITIGAVSSLWDFEEGVVPDEDALQAALKTVDYNQIKINGNEVSLGIEGAQLDLGGIAKGYIADRMTEQMDAAGVDSAIINLGGNIAALGEKETGVPWVIGIERPYSDRTSVVGALDVVNGTVTTSGVYERCFEKDGKMYHHVLDPATGHPMEVSDDAVTVQGPVGMSAESDAFGTMFLMLGEEKSAEILKQYPEFKAAFVDENDNITTINGMKITPVE